MQINKTIVQINPIAVKAKVIRYSSLVLAPFSSLFSCPYSSLQAMRVQEPKHDLVPRRSALGQRQGVAGVGEQMGLDVGRGREHDLGRRLIVAVPAVAGADGVVELACGDLIFLEYNGFPFISLRVWFLSPKPI